MVEQAEVLRLGIVGGGQGGLEMLKLFAGSDQVKVCYMIDRDLEAAGMVAAKEMGIPVETDLVTTLKRTSTNFIIEATGVDKVRELIVENKSPKAEMISSNASLMFFNVVVESRRKNNKSVFSEINSISEEITQSSDTVKKSASGITQIALNLEMLAINAAIEAARAGVKGRSFSVVADAVKKTAKEAKILVESIESVNSRNAHMSIQLDGLLDKLH